MDINTAGALNLYTYQTALRTGGQASALAQVMGQVGTITASGETALPGTSNSLSGQASMNVGTYDAAVKTGTDTSELQILLQEAMSRGQASNIFDQNAFDLNAAAAAAYAKYQYQQASDSSVYLQQVLAGANSMLAGGLLNVLG